MNSRVGGDDERLGPRVALSPRDILCRSRGYKIFSSGRFRCNNRSGCRFSTWVADLRSGLSSVFSSRQRFSAHRFVRRIFPLRNKNGPGYTLRTVIRYDDEKSSRHACPEALAVGIVGIELDRHAPLQTRSLTRDALGSFVRSFVRSAVCVSSGAFALPSATR